MNIFQDFRVGSLCVKAKITQPSDKTNSLLPVRALVHVSKKYPVKSGDILKAGDDEKWLLVKHHIYYRNQVFLGLSVNAQVRVETRIKQVDPTTRMPTNGIYSDSYLCDTVKEVEDPREVKGLTQSQSVYYFPQQISTGDIIDGEVVSKVIPISGIYRVEV